MNDDCRAVYCLGFTANLPGRLGIAGQHGGYCLHRITENL